MRLVSAWAKSLQLGTGPRVYGESLRQYGVEVRKVGPALGKTGRRR